MSKGKRAGQRVQRKQSNHLIAVERENRVLAAFGENLTPEGQIIASLAGLMFMIQTVNGQKNTGGNHPTRPLLQSSPIVSNSTTEDICLATQNNQKPVEKLSVPASHLPLVLPFSASTEKFDQNPQKPNQKIKRYPHSINDMLAIKFLEESSEENIAQIKMLVNSGAKMIQDDIKNQALYDSIAGGNIERLKILQQLGWNLNKVMKNARHPFEIACIKANIQVIETLIELKADIYAGESPDAVKAFEALFHGFNFHKNNENNRKERLIVFKKLFSLWPEANKDRLIKGILLAAKEAGWTELVDFLSMVKCERLILELNKLAESNYKDTKQNIHIQLDSKLEELLSCIEKNPALLDSDRNNILLNNAVLDGNPEAIQRLIACNCDVNKKTFFTTALSTAFNQPHSEKNLQLIEILIKADAKMAQDDESNKYLYKSILEKNIPRLKFLKQLGWDMSQSMKGDLHPFLRACEEGNLDVIHTLIELKADIYAGESPDVFQALLNGFNLHKNNENNRKERLIVFKKLFSLWPEANKDRLITSILLASKKAGWTELVDFLSMVKCERIILNINKSAESTDKDTTKSTHFNLDSELEELLTCIEKKPALLDSDRNNILLNNAVIDQKPEAIQRLIACNCDVNKKTFFTTALSTAFHQLHSEKNIQLIEILVKADAKMPQNDNNIFLLYLAIKERNIQRLVSLKKIGWNMNQSMKRFPHPFIFACNEGNSDVVHTLIELKADIYAGESPEAFKAFEALFDGFNLDENNENNRKERLIVFKKLFSLWPEANKDRLITSILLASKKTGWTELVDFLSMVKCERIILNINKDAEDALNGITVGNPELEWEELLACIEKSPDILLGDKYNTLLYQAIHIQKLEIVQKLLACGYDVNKKTSYSSVLFSAFYQPPSDKNIELIEILINAGAKMAQDDKNNKYLYKSIQQKNIPRLKFLKKIGWDMDRSIPGSLHPFVLACREGNAAVVEILIELGGYAHVSKHPKNKEALNMLFDGFNKSKNDGSQRLIIFKKLISLGSDLSLIKKNFLLTAREKGWIELVEYLETIDQKSWSTVFFENPYEFSLAYDFFLQHKFLSDHPWLKKTLGAFVFLFSSFAMYWVIAKWVSSRAIPTQKTPHLNKKNLSPKQKESKSPVKPTTRSENKYIETNEKPKASIESLRARLDKLTRDLTDIEKRILNNKSDIEKYNTNLNSKKEDIGDDNKDKNKFSKSIFTRKEVSLDKIIAVKNTAKLLQEKLKLFLENESTQDETTLEQTESKINKIGDEIRSLNEELKTIHTGCSSLNDSLEELYKDYNTAVGKAISKEISDTPKKPKKPSGIPQIPIESQGNEKKSPSIPETKKSDIPNQKLSEFTTWYHADDCNKLLGNTNDRSEFISVIFGEDQGDNTKLFKNQLQQLVFLCEKLNQPAIFICKEPGASIHFICGIIKNGQLLLINPLGENQEICNHILDECIAEKIISTLWTSTTKLQQKKHESKENFLYSCGPIVLELSNHILTLWSKQLENFWRTLNTNTKIVDISLLLPQNLKNLLQSKNQRDYQQKICTIRMKHCKQLDSCADNNELPDSQATFHALVMGEFTIGNIDQMSAYQSLVLKILKNNTIVVHRHSSNLGIPLSLLPKHSIFSTKKNSKKTHQKATPEEAQKTAMELYLQISVQLSTLTSHDFELKIEQDIYKLALAYYVMRLFNALLEMHGGEQNKTFTLITNLCNLRNPLVKCALTLETDINAFVSFGCEINTAFQSIYEDYKKSTNISHEKLFAFCEKIQQSDFYKTLWQEWEKYQLNLKPYYQNDIQENIQNLISYLSKIGYILKVVNGSNELKNHPDRVAAAKALLIGASQIYVDFIQKNDQLQTIIQNDNQKSLNDFFNALRQSRNKSAHEAKSFHDIDEIQIMNFKSRIETTILPILNTPKKTMALITSAPRHITGSSTPTITPK